MQPLGPSVGVGKPQAAFSTPVNIFKMDMVSGPLMLKSAFMGGGAEMAPGYGKEIARKLGASVV